jgi:hypothetical protein
MISIESQNMGNFPVSVSDFVCKNPYMVRPIEDGLIMMGSVDMNNQGSNSAQVLAQALSRPQS